MHDRVEDFLSRHRGKIELIANLAGLVAIVLIEVAKKAGRGR
ncbi:MAG: hypothetical protein Q8O67_15030 [Deltaproteobacteria bacterium]|nr:hypothetical protein [Deltaproteobacteria bacterium]